MHAVVDAEGQTFALDLTAGLKHDSQKSRPMLDAMRQGTIVLADKTYESKALRAAADQKEALVNIPAKAYRKDSFAFCR
ncbi:MAG: hypothetical protein B7Z26_06730 [Asticcacaulis sp. 32-58-5]|nr:MAG: hypothetical protein B7Z26_06730 [Asticcacaulis sp. 32-58-5]